MLGKFKVKTLAFSALLLLGVYILILLHINIQTRNFHFRSTNIFAFDRKGLPVETFSLNNRIDVEDRGMEFFV